MLRTLVGQGSVDLVRDDAPTVGGGDICELLELALRQAATGRVPRIAEDKRTRSLSKCPIHSIDVDPVDTVSVTSARHFHEGPAGTFHHREERVVHRCVHRHSRTGCGEMDDGSTDAFDNIGNRKHSIGTHFPAEMIGPECDCRLGRRPLADQGEVGRIATVDGVM